MTTIKRPWRKACKLVRRSLRRPPELRQPLRNAKYGEALEEEKYIGDKVDEEGTESEADVDDDVVVRKAPGHEAADKDDAEVLEALAGTTKTEAAAEYDAKVGARLGR